MLTSAAGTVPVLLQLELINPHSLRLRLLPMLYSVGNNAFPGPAQAEW